MILGFTGTREGMSDRQKALFIDRLSSLCPGEFHHGDDDGADREAHELVRLCVPRCIIVLHPPNNPFRRAFCKADREMQPKPYLARNKAIVFCCDELIAAPLTPTEELRSGTWATIRYARKAGKQVHLLIP